MKNYSSKTFLTCFFTVTTLILLTSCFPDAAEPGSSLRIPVQLNDLDSTLTAGDDSLTVERVRFISGLNYFTIGEDSIIYLTGIITQLSFSLDLEDNVELIYPFAGIPEGVYQALTFKIIRAPESVPDSIRVGPIDPIFTEDGRYSLIINGSYNGEEFTYKTTEEFVYNFEFIPPVSVNSGGKAYVFLISANIESWFRKDEGAGFLNPTDNENKALINANIAESFTIEQLSPE